jgi:hypothetical protein
MPDDQLTVVIADGSVKGLRSKGLGSGGALQGQVVVVAEHVRVYDGVTSIALTATAAGLGTIPPAATHALIYAEGAAATDYCRYWQDSSTNPTPTSGKRLKDHEEMSCASPSVFKAINGSGSGAITLRVEFYHYA